MDIVFEWLNPLRWFEFMQNHLWVTLAIGAPLAALFLWRLSKGGLGIRRAAINIVGIGLLIWGTLWFADWVKPPLISEDLFTRPVVGPQAVKAALIKQKTLKRFATYSGVVHPYERIVVRARTDGFVNEIGVYPGDHVKKNQVLVRLEVSQMTPKLRKAQAELQYLSSELTRDLKLFQEKSISASALDLSRRKESVAAANVSLLETEIGYATIRALSEGWVSKRAVDKGQYVRKGDHLLAYQRLAQVRVRFNLAIQDLVNIQVGTEVILEFPEIPSDSLKGSVLSDMQVERFAGPAIKAKVSVIFPSADEKSRLGVVEILLKNPKQFLKSNTYVVGHFVTGVAEKAWVVPEQALTLMPGGKTVIFLAPPFSDQGEAVMREVKVGLRNGKEAQIVKGIEEPGYVIIAGNRSLSEGETVMVVAREGGI